MGNQTTLSIQLRRFELRTALALLLACAAAVVPDAEVRAQVRPDSGEPVAEAHGVGAVNPSTEPNVCDRTPQVREEIVRQTGRSSCETVTDQDLAELNDLDLKDKSITALKAGDFAGLQNLQQLQLRGNQLRGLPAGVFAGLTNLGALWLDLNPLSELPANVFVGLSSLNSLLLGHTELTALPPGLFAGLARLGSLSIYANSKLTALPPDLFADLTNLHSLSLDQNPLASLPAGVFGGLKNLRNLWLRGTQLTQLPAGIFAGLANLEVLRLKDSRLSGLPAGVFAGLTRLRELSLGNNRLTELPAGLFAGLADLNSLSLSGNPGAPFALMLELERTDTSNRLAPSPAEVAVELKEGAPFAISVELLVVNGWASASSFTIDPGGTASATASITASSSTATHVGWGSVTQVPGGFTGLEMRIGNPLALFAESDKHWPVTRGAIPSYTLQVDGPEPALSVQGYFSDADGAGLTYSVMSKNEHVVSARTNGSAITLIPKGEGYAPVAVTATDPDGLSASQDIAVTVLPVPDPGSFDIDLVFTTPATEKVREIAREQAKRWSEVITDDLPDVPLSGDFADCQARVTDHRFYGSVDDLVVLVQLRPVSGGKGFAGPCGKRPGSFLPSTARLVLDTEEAASYDGGANTILHEVGHALGIGSIWNDLGFLQDTGGADPHFNGPLAIAAFDAAGGANYTGAKVPVSDDLGHWRGDAFGWTGVRELMMEGGGTALSAITIQSLADLGYGVDVSQADPFWLPTNAKAPTGLTATPVSSSRIDLAWQDNSADEAGFRVQRRIDGSSVWVGVGTTTADATIFSDDGLLPATTYHYRVQAFNGTATSAFSKEATATTLAVPAPTLTHFIPTSGPAATWVTLTGTHFLDATDVRFNGVSSLEFEVLSMTGIRAVVPPGATTGPISVVTPGGTAVSSDPFTVTGGGTANRLFVPVLLTAAGRSNAFFTSELTLTNRGTEEATLHYTYTPDAGGGNGAASDTLAPGQQRIQTDAIDYLSGLGIPIPGSGNRIGTLRVGVSGSSEVSLTTRTTTAVPDGRAGLAYPAIAREEGFQEAVYLCGLRQNRQDRSNVAFQHMGAPRDGPITLRTTIYSGEADDTRSRMVGEVELQPGGFHQHSGLLGRLGSPAQGYVKVEKVQGEAPFYAYGVINDNFNSDGSFVFPVTESSLVGTTGQTLPVIIETGNFQSELTVTNFSAWDKTIDFSFVADGVDTGDDTAEFSLTLKAGEQTILPGIVEELRRREVAGIGPANRAYVGALFARAAEGDLSGIVIGARTGAPDKRGGQYSLFYNGVPNGGASVESAWIYGLQQNAENRSNLALVNTGEIDDSSSTFEITIYDGSGESQPRTRSLTLGPRRWTQINGILGRISQGYVQVRKVSGNNPFVAYGVINDGGRPGERSGDGAFLPARD